MTELQNYTITRNGHKVGCIKAASPREALSGWRVSELRGTGYFISINDTEIKNLWSGSTYKAVAA